MLAIPHRSFALKKPDNWHLIDKELQQQEEKAFEEKLTEEQRQFLRRERMVMLQFQKKLSEDDMNWWTKIKNMSDYDLQLLPFGFLKKYGSMLNFIRRMEKEYRVQENKNYMGYYKQIQDADKLEHDSEKEAHR